MDGPLVFQRENLFAIHNIVLLMCINKMRLR